MKNRTTRSSVRVFFVVAAWAVTIAATWIAVGNPNPISTGMSLAAAVTALVGMIVVQLLNEK